MSSSHPTGEPLSPARAQHNGPEGPEESPESPGKEEDEEEDDELLDDAVDASRLELFMRERRRACSLPAYPLSLLEAPGASGGPGRKKSVKFADSLGLTLTRVKTFSALEEPRVPSTVLSRHRSFPPVFPVFPVLQEPDRLVPVFPELRDAERRAARLRVCLERISVSQFDVRGHIRVRGGGTGRREVGVRYTFNDWLSHVDAQALAVPADEHRFSFTVYTPPFMEPGARVHMAVYLRDEHEDFWDNNEGQNYTLRYRRTGTEPPLTAAFHAT